MFVVFSVCFCFYAILLWLNIRVKLYILCVFLHVLFWTLCAMLKCFYCVVIMFENLLLNVKVERVCAMKGDEMRCVK
jgi:hypothetical protein